MTTPDLNGALARLGYSSFRPNQEDIVSSLLAGRDVLATMPTGSGKSLCYMLPATLREGLTLVVTPLISLMQDQVRAALSRGIQAAYVSASMPGQSVSKVYHKMRSGELRLLYVAPERLQTRTFQAMPRSVRIGTVIVDEAHCIYEYGAEFRPAYRTIAAAVRPWREAGAPIGAFTGTATRRTEGYIAESLGLRDPFVVRASFNRPNLYYEVGTKHIDDERQLLGYVSVAEGCGIVYRSTRARADATAEYLRRHGVWVAPYHAGLHDAERITAQRNWMAGLTQVIVATTAFGMGIDKPDCRWVVHADMPKSMEGYYQETGRAGRDGEPAHCLLLWSYGDIPEVRRQCEAMEDPEARTESIARLHEVIAYAQQSAECRRTTTLRYFDEVFVGPCDACDVCCARSTKEVQS